MKKTTLFIIIAVVGVAVLAGGAYYLHTKNVQRKQMEVQGLNPIVYPLYPGASWGSGHPDTQSGLTGFLVTSLATSTTNDIAAMTKPFEQYYRDKLTNDGWTVDNALAAGGPGSALTAYQKNGMYVVIGYTTAFANSNKNQPVQCPCKVTLGIFSGAVSNN